MPFNGPINGDWSVCDMTKPPFTNGIMTLTHEEVLQVKEDLAPLIPGHETDDMYVVSNYNKLDWTYCINGDTYNCIKQYDPEVNTLGININGIIVPEEPPTEEVTPIEEV